ncbi:MAG: hypothetical protein GX286_05210 [Clostridiales bacterium]|jgi:hypothetical protein|nr:hypothetical protein [Clostridiales bacterium]
MNNNINPKNLDAMLKIAGKKLNMDPKVLKTQLEQGKFDAALKNMNSSDAEKFKKVMNNPKLAEQLMSSEQAQALYKKLMSGK